MFAFFPCCFFPFAGLLGIASMVFWIWALIDVVTHEPSEEPDKLVWVLVVALLHALGALIYVLVRRPERMRKYGR